MLKWRPLFPGKITQRLLQLISCLTPAEKALASVLRSPRPLSDDQPLELGRLPPSWGLLPLYLTGAFFLAGGVGSTGLLIIRSFHTALLLFNLNTLICWTPPAAAPDKYRCNTKEELRQICLMPLKCRQCEPPAALEEERWL